MLPLPRPRPDPEVVRARLRALAQGAWGELPDDVAVDDAPADALPARGVVVTRAPVRVVALAVGATAVATWVVVHLTAGGSPSPVQVLPGTPLPSASASAVPVPTLSAPAPDLVVQVLGEVRRPGLVRLAPGSRVADALASAGGLVRGGGTGGLNLARLVVDGEQIVVSADSPVGAPAAASSSGGGADVVVDLNTATTADLDSLPGVGPVMAARILEWRTEHGRFASVDQLKEVSGIGARTFERLRPHVRV